MSSPFLNDAFLMAPWRSAINKKVVMQRSGGSHFSENDDRIQLSVDVPGVKAKELTVKVENGILTIGGTRKVRVEQGCKRYKFEKNFSIDAECINVASMTANLHNGVLTLKAPKQKKAGPFYIEVTEDDAVSEEEEEEEEEEPEEEEEVEDKKMPADPKKIKKDASQESAEASTQEE